MRAQHDPATPGPARRENGPGPDAPPGPMPRAGAGAGGGSTAGPGAGAGAAAGAGAILEAVAAAAERLLVASGWREVIDGILTDLGGAAGVSRAYVFENRSEDGRVVACAQRAEWAAPGITPQILNPDLELVPYDPDFARWRDALSAEGAVLGHVRELPEPERHLLEAQDIRSVAVVPLFAGQEWWGFLGFAECLVEREWSPAEIGALKAAAGILGAAIARERSEAALRESEERYRALVELSPDAIAVHRGGVITFANSRARGLLRARSDADLVGRSVLEFVHPDARPRVLERLQRLREGREVPPIEEKFVRVDGTVVDVEVTAAPFAEGGESAVQVVVRDVTERKSSDRALQMHSEYLEALHDTTLTLVNRLDVQDLLVAIVARAAALLGTESGYVYVVAPDGEHIEVKVGTGVYRDWTGFRMVLGEGLAGRVWQSGQPLAIEDYDTWEGRSPSFPKGVLRAGVGVPFTSEGRVVGVLGLSHGEPGRRFSSEDISVLTRFAELASIALDNARLYTEARQELAERRRAEERLRFSAHLLDSVENAVIATDAEDRITYWNKFSETLYGWRIEEVMGLRFRDVIPISDEVAEAANRAVAAGETFETDMEVRRRDGSPIIVFARVSPIRSSEGRTMGMIGVTVDVTGRRRAEEAVREAFEREREAARRFRELDEMKNMFLEAVSHELRTPLSAILGFALTLERSDMELPEHGSRELVSRLAVNARKLDRLLSDLLDLDRLSRGILEPRRRAVDVGSLAGQVVEATETTRGRNVVVDADHVTAWLDGPKVERIVENLVANAIRHTPDGTRIWVRVRQEDDGVLIAVEDEGPGVPPELQSAIFEPFRQGPQTRSHSPGVGVGLSLVARFAELHGGRAWVEDREGGGSSFRVWLPSVEPDPPPWRVDGPEAPHDPDPS